MTYTGFITAQQVMGQVPMPTDAPALHKEIARGIGRALPGAVRANPISFTAARASLPLALVAFAEPFAREAWEQFIQESIPVNWEIPAPLIPSGSDLIWSCRTNWKNKSTGGIVPEFRNGSQGLYNQIVRGASLVTATNGFMNVGFRARNTDGIVDPITMSNNYDPAFWEFDSIGTWEVRTAPLAPPLSTPFAPVVPLPTSPPPNWDVPMTIPMDPVPGLVPSPIQIPVVIPSPSEIPNHPIPLQPVPSTDPEREAPRFPPIWLSPGGVQIGNPPQSPVIFPPTAGIPDTQTQEELERQRRRIGIPCLPCPGEGGCDCDDIRTIVKEEVDEKFPPARPNTLQTITLGIANSLEFVLPAYTQKVTLELIDVPTNARSQAGMAAPDVYYAGWNAFDTGERTPVSYESNTYYPPTQDVKRWSYTLYTGFTGRAVIYYLVPPP